MGHARALLVLERAQQILAANQVVDKRLSVRETEKLVAQLQARAQDAGSTRSTPRSASQDVDLLRLQEQIAQHLQTAVELSANARGKGRLVIRFDSVEQFEGIRSTLGLAEDRLAD
jgi:ParB family chromosome partitioning protein